MKLLRCTSVHVEIRRPVQPNRLGVNFFGSLFFKELYHLWRTNRCDLDLHHWRDGKCSKGLAPAGFFRSLLNLVRVVFTRVDWPSLYELWCYRSVGSYCERLDGKYVPLPNWRHSNRGIDPTRVRRLVDAQRFGHTRHRSVSYTEPTYLLPLSPRIPPSGITNRLQGSIPSLARNFITSPWNHPQKREFPWHRG